MGVGSILAQVSNARITGGGGSKIAKWRISMGAILVFTTSSIFDTRKQLQLP